MNSRSPCAASTRSSLVRRRPPLTGDFDQPNGLCVSPDERLLYVNDTARMHIRRFTFDGDAVRNGTVFAVVEGEGGNGPRRDEDRRKKPATSLCTGPGGLHFFTPELRAWGCCGRLRESRTSPGVTRTCGRCTCAPARRC